MKQSKKELKLKLTQEKIHTNYSNRESNRAAARQSRSRVRNNSIRTMHPSEKEEARIKLSVKLDRSIRLNTRKDLLTK